MLTDIYKSRTENIWQLWSKDGHQCFNKIKTYERFQKILQVLHLMMHMQKKKKKPQNDKNLSEVFEIWNQYLQDKYTPSSFMYDSWPVVSYIQTMLPISGTHTFKPWKTFTKNLGNTGQWIILNLKDADLHRFRKGWEQNQE